MSELRLALIMFGVAVAGATLFVVAMFVSHNHIASFLLGGLAGTAVGVGAFQGCVALLYHRKRSW